VHALDARAAKALELGDGMAEARIPVAGECVEQVVGRLELGHPLAHLAGHGLVRQGEDAPVDRPPETRGRPPRRHVGATVVELHEEEVRLGAPP
jgi:hypothetical protein